MNRVWTHLARTLVPCALLALPCAATLSACDGGEAAKSGADGAAAGATGSPAVKPASPKLSEAQYAELVQNAKLQLNAESIDASVLAQIDADLKRVTHEAADLHMRANASLLLGALAEAAQDQRAAISFYTQAQVWLPEEPSTHAVLALALAADGQHAAAQKVQQKLVDLTPDDLEAWLIWGEMRFKAGDETGAKEVYAGYEMRRKGLLNGLTLKKEGVYVSSEEDRVACVENLVAASDNGTALALLYALESDPSREVQVAILALMGTQRLQGYVPALKAFGKKLGAPVEGEDAKVQAAREQLAWALAEIERQPVDTKPGGAPWDPSAAVPSEGDAAAETGSETGTETGSETEAASPEPQQDAAEPKTGPAPG